MTEYIQWILLSVFWIWGFQYSFRDGEILGKLGNWARCHWEEWVLSPTIECNKCMSSVHGTFWYLYAYWQDYNFFMHALFVVAICGLNDFLSNLIEE